jgi:hypothetical protein
MKERITDMLMQRHDLILNLINKTEQKLKCFPEGRVCVKRHGDKPYYYYVSQNAPERILKSEDSSLLDALLQKSYLEKVLRVSKKEILLLNKLMSRYPDPVAEEVYDQLKSDRKINVKPIVKPIEQYVQEWQNRPYEKKAISEDVPIFKTMKGECVRSKSEVIIADRLNVNGIPYKYECPIMVAGEIIHPDFTILRKSDRKILYLEHCGKMDDPKYAEDMVTRVNNYALEGIIMGDRLFYTVESSQNPLDVRVLDVMIQNQFR